MTILTELANYSNDEKIDGLSTEEIHQLYLKIKEDLPLLQITRNVIELKNAIKDYERRHGIV